jgi:transcriptional regulator with XRE-family HTH domain
MSILEKRKTGNFFGTTPTRGMKSRDKLPRIDMQSVGLRLEAMRHALNLSRHDFAVSFGLDPSSYTKTVGGEKQLRSEAAYVIAERWGVSMDYIFRGRLTDLPEHLRESILKHLNTGA